MSEDSVLKFGGSSMACPERAAEVFAADPGRNRIAVVSAIGVSDELGGDIKITDLLGELEAVVDLDDQAAASRLRERVLQRNRQVFAGLGKCALSRVCDAANEALQSENREQGFKWVGEWMCAQLFAELTGTVYVPSGLRFADGKLELQESLDTIRQTVEPILASGRQVVTEGFFGYDASGYVATLPRGGSDISGVIYTGAFNDGNDRWINQNYTNKDGVLSADPDIVPGARVIPEMTYEEVREKMHGVSERNGIIHGDAIAYAAILGVEIYVKNTFNPTAAGTHIVASRQLDENCPVIGVSGKDQLTAIDVYDMGMADAKGYLAGVLGEIERQGMSVANIPTSEDRLKIILNHGATEDGLNHVREYIRRDAISGKRAEVEVNGNEGAVYLVGQELTEPLVYTRILAKAVGLLADVELPVRGVISHEKSPSLALIVAGSEVPRIIRLLHEELAT
jgi:aspartate kinase